MRQFIAILLLSAATALLAPGFTLAQTSATGASIGDSVRETQSISLDQAIQMALQKNYTVQIASNDVVRAQYDQEKAKDFLLPQANLSAGYNFNKGLSHTIFAGQDLGLPAATHGLNYNARGSINIFNGFGDVARIHSSEFSLESAQSNFQWTKQQIAFNVTTSYLDVLRNSELVDAATKTLAEAQAQLNQVRGQYEAGVVPIAQVYQQEAVVGQDELAVIQARNNYENAKADLLFLLNIPPTEYATYGVNVSGIDTSTSTSRRAEVRRSVSNEQVQQVIDTRPDIVSQQQAIQSAKAAVDVTRSALYPSLDADVGVGGSGDNTSISSVRLSNGLTAGLTFNWLIFDRFQTRLSVDEQLVNIENSEIQLNQQVQSLRSDVAKAVNNLRFAEQALDASDREVRSAEEGLRLAEERLRVGAGTQVDVIVAQSQVETARTNRINAVFNYVLAQKQIQYTLGQWSY